MARRCELTGKQVVTGYNVSHAHNRTKRRFLPNLCNVSLISDALGTVVRLRISAHALRTVDYKGGIDAFLRQAKDKDLSLKARRFKRRIERVEEATKSESSAA